MKKYLVKDDSNKLLINFLDEDLQKIKEYCDNEYFFQDYILINKNKNRFLSDLIKEFFLSYFARVKCLEKMDEKVFITFYDWFNKKGKIKIKKLLNLIDENINREYVINVLTTYDGLIEQGLDEGSDCLLDTLIDAPSSIYKEISNLIS